MRGCIHSAPHRRPTPPPPLRSRWRCRSCSWTASLGCRRAGRGWDTSGRGWRGSCCPGRCTSRRSSPSRPGCRGARPLCVLPAPSGPRFLQRESRCGNDSGKRGERGGFGGRGEMMRFRGRTRQKEAVPRDGADGVQGGQCRLANEGAGDLFDGRRGGQYHWVFAVTGFVLSMLFLYAMADEAVTPSACLRAPARSLARQGFLRAISRRVSSRAHELAQTSAHGAAGQHSGCRRRRLPRRQGPSRRRRSRPRRRPQGCLLLAPRRDISRASVRLQATRECAFGLEKSARGWLGAARGLGAFAAGEGKCREAA